MGARCCSVIVTSFTRSLACAWLVASLPLGPEMDRWKARMAALRVSSEVPDSHWASALRFHREGELPLLRREDSGV